MTKPPPKLPSMFEMLLAQAASAANQEPPRQWPMNPFPSGIRAGSVTDRVLAELRRVAPQALEHGQLRMRCQAGRGAVNWATAFLIHLGEIVAVSDPRSPQYNRYRLASKPAKAEVTRQACICPRATETRYGSPTAPGRGRNDT